MHTFDTRPCQPVRPTRTVWAQAAGLWAVQANDYTIDWMLATLLLAVLLLGQLSPERIVGVLT